MEMLMRAFALVVTLGVAVPAHALSPREIYQKSGPSVVLILSSDDGRTGQGGTGSILTPDGKVLTNGHVILNDSGKPFKTIYVFLKPDKVTGDNAQDLKQRYTAHVLQFSPPTELDMALLQIDQAPADLPVMAIGDPNSVSVGDPVVAIGHPEQGGLWTLTTGTISTVIQNFDRIKGKNVFQTEASFNRGNSGGPLLDASGNMIGINTMIARKANDGMAITAVNFSLKSSVAMEWLKSKTQLRVAYSGPSDASVTGTAVASNDPPPAPSAHGKSGHKQQVPATTAAAAAPQQTDTAPTGAVPNSTPAATTPPPAVKNIVTEKRPYQIDQLLKDQMREMEDMMDDMHEQVQRSRAKGKR